MSLRQAATQKNISVRIRTGSPGNLQIFKDGAKLFDYKQAGTLPETDKLLRLIEAAP